MSQATRDAVTDLYAAYARRDFERVAALIDDDIDWIIYGPVQVFPFAGHRHGKAAVLTALGGIAQDYALERYVPQIMIVEDDRAAVMSDVAFKQRSTGRMITAQLAEFSALSRRAHHRVSRIRQHVRPGRAGASATSSRSGS